MLSLEVLLLEHLLIHIRHADDERDFIFAHKLVCLARLEACDRDTAKAFAHTEMHGNAETERMEERQDYHRALDAGGVVMLDLSRLIGELVERL